MRLTLRGDDEGGEVHLEISQVAGLDTGYLLVVVSFPARGLRAHFKDTRLGSRVNNILVAHGVEELHRKGDEKK
jgi:hypothetical protein